MYVLEISGTHHRLLMKKILAKTRDLIVSSSFYRKVRGNTLDLILEKGLLSYPVITDF